MNQKHEIGLTRTIKSLEEYNLLKVDDLFALKFTGIFSHKEYTLKEFKYIDCDIFTDSKNKEFEKNIEIDTTTNTAHFSNIVFTNHEKVLFHNCGNMSINFYNCVFTSRICFCVEPESFCADNCIFQFLNLKTKRISIVASLINEILFRDKRSEDQISIWNSEIKSLRLCDSEIVNSFFLGNNIRRINICGSVSQTAFDYRQLACFSSGKTSISIKKIKELVDYSKISIETRISTLNYIQSLDIIREDAGICARIDYLKCLSVDKPLFKKLVLGVCGYFMRPGQIIIESCITLITFTLIFLLVDIGKIELNHFLHYCELSCTSFFGNINDGLPKMLRIFCYAEQVMGFILMNIFTISLAKKYLK